MTSPQPPAPEVLPYLASALAALDEAESDDATARASVARGTSWTPLLLLLALACLTVAVLGVRRPGDLAVIGVFFDHVAILVGLALVLTLLAFLNSRVSWWNKTLVMALLTLPVSLLAPLGLHYAPFWQPDALTQSPNARYSVSSERSVGAAHQVWQLTATQTGDWSAKAWTIGCVGGSTPEYGFASMTWVGRNQLMVRNVDGAAALVTFDAGGAVNWIDDDRDVLHSPGLLGCR